MYLPLPYQKETSRPFKRCTWPAELEVAEMQHAATHIVGLMDCWDLAIIIP